MIVACLWRMFSFMIQWSGGVRAGEGRKSGIRKRLAMLLADALPPQPRRSGKISCRR